MKVNINDLLKENNLCAFVIMDEDGEEPATVLIAETAEKALEEFTAPDPDVAEEDGDNLTHYKIDYFRDFIYEMTPFTGTVDLELKPKGEKK
jgi:hypothetical protein